jgi:hypothetical protein
VKTSAGDWPTEGDGRIANGGPFANSSRAIDGEAAAGRERGSAAMKMRDVLVAMVLTGFSCAGLAQPARAEDFERPPISYSESAPDNVVSRLIADLDAGRKQLAYHEGGWGYLPALLEALDVPISSQALVFSQTSLQRSRISPKRPRAVYFNDDVYIGFCQSGDVLEVSVADPQLGAVFYTVDQKQPDKPRLDRQTDACLLCHSSSRTESVPGHLVRSLLVDRGGQPLLSAGSYTVDHRTPLERRWGGWYVTSQKESPRHLGNLILRGSERDIDIDSAQGPALDNLQDCFDVSRYLAPHSDIVALMVLEHQALVHNRIAKASFAARQAMHYEEALRKALNEAGDEPLESTTRRIQSAGDDLVDALLFVDEAALPSPIAGTSAFAQEFAERGPFDGQGRSLRQFDLRSRMFAYPCSYLIYSDAFAALPKPMHDFVWQRLREVLIDGQHLERFPHLSDLDRQAIVEILRATVPDLPADWAAPTPAE